MKLFLTGLFSVLLFADAVFGQSSEVIIKQRAKELSNQNNVRQGVAPPAQPPGAPAATPVTQAQNPALTKLQTDLAAIQAGSIPTAEQKQKIATDIIAASQGTKPSAAAA